MLAIELALYVLKRGSEAARLLEERLDAILDGGFKFQRGAQLSKESTFVGCSKGSAARPNTMELQLGSAIALSKVAQLLKA